MSAAHVLTLSLASDKYSTELQASIKCNVEGPDKACAVWYSNDRGECLCRCVGCEAGNHDDCDQEWIPEVGQKWCKSHPSSDECIYELAMGEVGAEMLRASEAFSASWPVHLHFVSWDECIEVRPECGA